jgi:two-component system LytT family response regulator
MAATVADSINSIRQLKPDLVLLDLHLSDGTGFKILHAMEKIDFRVIFISAMDKETIKAFKLSGMEYLLKPLSPLELAEAISRVMKSDIRDFALQLQALEGNVNE